MSCWALAQGAGLGTAVPPKTETGGGVGLSGWCALAPPGHVCMRNFCGLSARPGSAPRRSLGMSPL